MGQLPTDLNGHFMPNISQMMLPAMLSTAPPPILNPHIYPRIPLPSAHVEEEPILVNPKQYHRILKRREARARQAANIDKPPAPQRKSKSYLHESRHAHAL